MMSGKREDNLRRSQLITTFGVGSIVDLTDNRSVMICGPQYWRINDTLPIHDNRLEEKLHVKYFITPPDKDDKTTVTSVPAVVFPRWMRCPRRGCGLLMPLKEWRKKAEELQLNKDFDSSPYCFIHHSSLLVPSRFIVACGKGHIDDFPYIKWAHRRKDSVCASPQLTYSKATGSSLESIFIKCRCGTRENMGGSFTRNILNKVAGCTGAEPWLKKPGQHCEEPISALQRGGTNTYFPTIRSSILIPPYSADVPELIANAKRIQDSETWHIYQSQTGALDLESFVIPTIHERTGLSLKSICEAIEFLENPIIETGDLSEENYRKQEYDAFTKSHELEQKDFVIERMNTEEYNTPFLSKVVLAKKLREVRAQTGFTRIKPMQSEEGSGDEIDEISIHEVSLKPYAKFPWLPAYEVRGEGIFLEFDAAQLDDWANNPLVQQRYQKLVSRLERSPDPYRMVEALTPQLVFLHSFAHLLIRQLSYECGYSASSLRERIYSSTKPGNAMSGLLIYTAEGDAEGTLGGLVRQGEADRLTNTIISGLKNAMWCSIDPLCIDSVGQGYQSLNLGACHSCILLPETSCELLNRFLDRASAIGTPNHPEIGFLQQYL